MTEANMDLDLLLQDVASKENYARIMTLNKLVWEGRLDKDRIQLWLDNCFVICITAISVFNNHT